MKNRLIINFRTEDMFTGCKPKPVEYGTVDGKNSAVVTASPGINCLACGAYSRCKENFVKVDVKLPSEVSNFSDS
jgi:hypothetical protein